MRRAFTLVLVALAVLGLIAWLRSPSPTMRVIDGDTIERGGERIRLNGIDAPEMPLHCRAGRVCVDGDPFESMRSLKRGLAQPGEIVVHRLKRDRYGRTVAQVTVGGVDLSCWQVAAGQAQYVARWDEGGIMDAACE